MYYIILELKYMSLFYENFWSQQKDNDMFDFPYKWPVIKNFIPTKPGLIILDYGAGSGLIMAEMKKINPESKYIGADVSAKALSFARKMHKKSKFLLVKDGGKIPLKNNSIDFILAADVIEHAFYTQELLNEFNRILKPGGSVLISTPYHGLIKNIVISIVGFEKVFNPVEAHIRFFTKKSLYDLLSKAKLSPTKFGFFGRFYPISRGMYVLAHKSRYAKSK